VSGEPVDQVALIPGKTLDGVSGEHVDQVALIPGKTLDLGEW
jgi:hypothetical protein